MPPEADDKAGAAAATTEDKPEVSFKTRAEFHAEVDRKTKAATSKAVEAARAELFSQLGIESVEDLTGLKEKLAVTEKQVSEAEKLKNAHDKTAKELDKALKKTEALTGRLKGIAKRDALAPFTTRVVDPEALAMFADRQLEVDEDGGVSVKDGGKLEDLVESLLKSKPYLKAPAPKEGAGTTAAEPRVAAKETPAKGEPEAAKTGNGAEPPQFGSFGEGIVAQLKAQGALPPMPAKGP